MAKPMSDVLFPMLVWILAMQAKHIVCDGPLQTLGMVRAKAFYGGPLGLAHGVVHGLGTAIVLLLAGIPLGLLAMLAAVDGLVHYHIDFVKENVVRLKGWSTEDGPYWWAMIVDQALHHMTGAVLVYWALTRG
jgi:hypothetical protein